MARIHRNAAVADYGLEGELEVAERRSVVGHGVIVNEVRKADLDRNVNVGSAFDGFASRSEEIAL